MTPIDISITIEDLINHSPQLRKAYDLAEKAHEGQRRQIIDEPYITHPKRVAFSVYRSMGLDTKAICAALLHDVVEDTSVTEGDIAREIGLDVAVLVSILTHEKDEDYFDYIRRVLKDPISCEIKRADVLDNMATLKMNGGKRWEKYTKTLMMLSDSRKYQI